MTYPKPATPLPWVQGVFATHVDDWKYCVHAASAFPHLVAALEAILYDEYHREHIARTALAIARGEVTL